MATPNLLQSTYKRRRLDNGTDPILYPCIPESAQDLEQNREFHVPDYWYSSVKSRLVQRIESAAWGPADVAAAKACVVPLVTVENEALIRTFHPFLAHSDQVWAFQEMTGNVIWGAYVSSNTCIGHTHAGGREIHILPTGFGPERLIHQFIERTIPICRLIYPRRMLTALDITAIKAAFPLSIGIRVLITGFAVMLFQSRTDMERTWKGGITHDIGGLMVSYDIIPVKPSIETGLYIASQPDTFESRGCIGLKIRRQDGSDAITTVTHGFVKLPDCPQVFLRLADWLVRAKYFLSRFISPKDTGIMPGEFQIREELTTSPLGKRVYLAGSAEMIGTITTSFDNPSSVLPYPAGYRHDLSLITGPELPDIVSPPGVGVIDDWASYEDALDGCPVFASRFDVRVNNNKLEQGIIATGATKAAVVQGAEYFWGSRAVSASLLWRTEWDNVPLPGFSGSVLCLGRPGDAKVGAVVFQNYETPIKETQVLGEGNLKGKSGWTIKGGFLLPQEIRESTIVSGMPRDDRNFHSVPTRNTSKSSGRRVFTDQH